MLLRLPNQTHPSLCQGGPGGAKELPSRRVAQGLEPRGDGTMMMMTTTMVQTTTMTMAIMMTLTMMVIPMAVTMAMALTRR